MPVVMKNGKPTFITIEEYNNTLQEYRENVLGVDETTGKLKNYSVEDLGKFWINGQEFGGIAYQGLLTVNTKTYIKEPKRSNDGSIPNINDYETFVVPRCTINLKYLNIYDYQRLCDATMSNEFYVEYYDKQFFDESTGTLQKVKHKMYAEPEEMAKLYNVGTDVFGVLDYSVSFIGTLNELDTFYVTYHSNSGIVAGNPQEYDSEKEYTQGDRVSLDGNRYFEAIYYKNTFNKSSETDSSLGSSKYWEKHLLSKYDGSTKDKGDIVYTEVFNEKNEVVGRNYYIALRNVTDDRPVTDRIYWEKITVKTYSEAMNYSSHKTYKDEEVYGDFVVSNDGTSLYEAIYFVNTFIGKDPTDYTYWKQLAINDGISLTWGSSLVLEEPMELFSNGTKVATKWMTKPNGGYVYNAGQSISVFKNINLYAKWEDA